MCDYQSRELDRRQIHQYLGDRTTTIELSMDCRCVVKKENNRVLTAFFKPSTETEIEASILECIDMFPETLRDRIQKENQRVIDEVRGAALEVAPNGTSPTGNSATHPMR